MIIQLKGEVKFPLTIDASVWIFDDRKIIFEEAFDQKKETEAVDPSRKTAEMFDQELYFKTKVKPPVNKSINKFEREKILTHSFVMPFEDFLNTSEVKESAKAVRLTRDEDDVIITIEQLRDAYFLFAVDGKPVKDEGPVHLYFKDGSNKEDPIKGVKAITIE